MYHQSFNSIGHHIYNGYVYQNTKQHDNFHNSFEYIFVWKGNISVTANNVKVNLAENDMMLIAPNIVHSLEVSPVTGSEYFIAVFSKDFISEFKNDELFYTAIKFKADKTVEDYLIENMFYSGEPEFYLLKSCLYAICSQCVKYGQRIDKMHNRSSKDFISKVNSYIFENINTKITQQAVADLFNYDRHYFSNLFNQTFRMGFSQYINTYRLNIACRLLTTTDMTITDIAFECGFENVRNFNLVFKKLTSKTPSQYRASPLSETVLPDHAIPLHAKTLNKLSKR